MQSDRWRRIEELYHAAVERDPASRLEFLDRACDGDAALRREVISLLANDGRASTFLESPALETIRAGSGESFDPCGMTISHYRVIEELGSGGMGVVYRATDIRLGRDVALKFLPQRLTSDPEALQRFQREARAASALNHPNICTLHDIGEFEGRPFIVMELLEGTTLKHRVCSRRIPGSEILPIATQIAGALEAAHAKGIVHRDIKPANIFITDRGHVKVLDFGLAKLTAQDLDGSAALTANQNLLDTLSTPGFAMGTLPYMSPEQIAGKPVDKRTDIWAFGCVLYEMLTGKMPFARQTAGETSAAIIERDPDWSLVPSGTSPAVVRLMRRCLQKDAGRRLHDIADARIELEESIAHPLEQDASIAVLAFTDMSATRDQDWFCDGIAEEILNALAQLDGLRVAARTSAFSFKGKGEDIRTIAEKLNVNTVLEGSVRRAGDRVRITAQLSDVNSGFQLWSERYDREIKDIFDVQDEIAKAIVERLKVTLTGAAGERLVERATTNIEAYELYLQGRALLDRRGASVPAAIELLQKAVELDPAYSSAWAAIAEGFTVLAYSGVASSSASRSQAILAARRSIELDPASAPGHASLACATLVYENNRVLARQEFARALDLNPKYIPARCWYALLYLAWSCGEFEQAIAEARRALESDPLSAYAMTVLGVCLFTAGRSDEAVAACRSAVQQDPESFVAHWALGISLRSAGRIDEASATLEKAAAMSGRHPLAVAALAEVFAQGGRRADASALHHELVGRAERGYVAASHLAMTAEAAGERDEAIAFARRGWDEREPSFILWARYFPVVGTLRSDPRFQAILREMNETLIVTKQIVTRPKQRLWIPIAAVVLLLIAAVVAFIMRPRPTVAAPNTIDAVAVLPFANDDPQTQYLSDGLTEILIDNLSHLPDLRVMARTTVFGYKGKDPREAGRALNVNAVVAGNLRHRGNDYVIHVEMIDVKDGTQLWGSQFDATGNTLSTVQSDMSDELTAQLRQGVSREQRRLAAQRYSADPRAYEAYLSGLYAWNKRDTQNAIRLFNEAIARDPKFAAAYAGLANTYGVLTGYGVLPVAEGTVKVMTAAQKALELDPNNASALVSIATTKYRRFWDFKGADADYQRALTLNPNYATGHQWYAEFLWNFGRWEEARRELEIARRLDPRSWAINQDVCWELYFERRYREAIEFAQRATPIDSGPSSHGFCISMNLLALGDDKAAVKALDGLKTPYASWQQIVTAYRRAGPQGDFRKSAELLERSQSDNVDTPLEIAGLYARAGDKDRTFAWLEKACQRRVSTVTDINVEPAFDSVRSDPRFDDLLRRIGLPKVNAPQQD